MLFVTLFVTLFVMLFVTLFVMLFVSWSSKVILLIQTNLPPTTASMVMIKPLLLPLVLLLCAVHVFCQYPPGAVQIYLMHMCVEVCEVCESVCGSVWGV
jgi:hypothetical protein